nr:MAG TPA: hypothetical protein [Caudoviricetes sp.]
MNDKIKQEAMHLHNWCEGQCDCAHCDFGRDNRTCKISGIPAMWFDDDEHPACTKTRQERFLEMFPHADVRNGVLAICPGNVDERLVCNEQGSCRDCLKEYWLAAEKEEKS